MAALLLCLGGALSWGWGNVVSRRLRVRSGLSMTVWSGAVVPLPMIALALALDGPDSVVHDLSEVSWRVMASAAFTALFASLLGYSIFNGLLARYPASSVLPFTLLVPPVGLLSAWLLMDQRPAPLEALGGGLLLAGVVVAQHRRRSSTPDAPVAARRADEPSGLSSPASTL
jgi:O-acetylserine/cysteine efflux transporter